MSSPERRGSIKIIAAGCLIFGLAWLTIGLPFFLRQTDVQRHWARANAKLLSASVTEDVTPGGKLYKTHFEFDLETLSSSRLAVVDSYRISPDRDKVEAEVTRWVPGVIYSVRSNPNNPAEIRLDVDRPFRHFFLPILFGGIAAVFFAISAALIFFSRR
jgi:hypothetical protein